MMLNHLLHRLILHILNIPYLMLLESKPCLVFQACTKCCLLGGFTISDSHSP